MICLNCLLSVSCGSKTDKSDSIMKRLIITALLSAVTMVMAAQEKIQFMNMPLGGDKAAMEQALVDKGFVLNEEKGWYVGVFEGYKDSRVTIGTDKGKVNQITVDLKAVATWAALRSTYDTFKKNYTERYGKCSCTEVFEEPYKEGDGKEITALWEWCCSFSADWELDGGFISVSISDDKLSQGGRVSVSFFMM